MNHWTLGCLPTFRQTYGNVPKIYGSADRELIIFDTLRWNGVPIQTKLVCEVLWAKDWTFSRLAWPVVCLWVVSLWVIASPCLSKRGWIATARHSEFTLVDDSHRVFRLWDRFGDIGDVFVPRERYSDRRRVVVSRERCVVGPSEPWRKGMKPWRLVINGDVHGCILW